MQRCTQRSLAVHNTHPFTLSPTHSDTPSLGMSALAALRSLEPVIEDLLPHDQGLALLHFSDQRK